MWCKHRVLIILSESPSFDQIHVEGYTAGETFLKPHSGQQLILVTWHSNNVSVSRFHQRPKLMFVINESMNGLV